MNTLKVFSVGRIPDFSEHRFAAVHEDVRSHIFDRAQHLLRMIGRLEDVSFTLRADFDPLEEDSLGRLRWSVLVASELSESTIDSLTVGGPLGAFYELEPCSESLRQTEFGFCFGVVRWDEYLRPWIPVELNSFIPRQYYSAQSFEPNEDNDFLMLDRALSNRNSAVRLEIQLAPTSAEELRSLHFEWISRLIAVNAYDDTYVPGLDDDYSDGESAFDEPWDSKPKKARDPLADEFLRENQDLFQKMRRPLYDFAIRVFSQDEDTARAIAATVAESCFLEGKYRLSRCDENLLEEELSACISGSFPRVEDGLRRLRQVATAEELLGAFRLPVAGSISPQCMRTSTDPTPLENEEEAILVGHDLEPGIEPSDLTDLQDLLSRRSWAPRLWLSLDLVKKHVFVAGVPGSGKTTAVFNLLAQLYRAGIPFLVIESAKTEYRLLKTVTGHPDSSVRRLGEDLRVYTPGNEELIPLRLNPFEIQAGVSRDEHIGRLMATLRASVPMWGPLEAIIADAIEESYRAAEPDFPIMEEVVQVAKRIANSKGYEGEVKSNIEAAIGVRLENFTRRSVGKIFEERLSVPDVATLLSKPTVLELDHLDQQTAAFLTLLVLSKIRQAAKIRGSGCPLTHVIVIEEAHNIVGRSQGSSNEESVDTSGFASSYVSRMLAELRALGEGLVIADQLPSTVAPEVVKNTGTKIAGRLVSRDDREELGSTMLLDAVQLEEIARLRPGEAYLYHEGLHRPRRIRALNANSYLGLGESRFPAGEEILSLVCEEEWFQETLKAQLRSALNHAERVNRDYETLAAELSALRLESESEFDQIGLCIELSEKRTKLSRTRSIFMMEVLKPIADRLDAYASPQLNKLSEALRLMARERLEPLAKALDQELSEQIESLENELGE